MIPVQWRVRARDDGSLRVVDIIVEGVSMAITLRSDYASAMQANGARIDGLLSTMRTKLDQLKASS
jgi:phospholipid transport system substrate-binding protein